MRLSVFCLSARALPRSMQLSVSPLATRLSVFCLSARVLPRTLQLSVSPPAMRLLVFCRAPFYSRISTSTNLAISAHAFLDSGSSFAAI